MNIRHAMLNDVPVILRFIRELAEYERAPNEVTATEELLRRHLFEPADAGRPVAEALIGELDGEPRGFALYFTNFSTWMGRPGVYLEDLYVTPAARRRGLGRALLARVARIAVERGAGRLDWSVLNWNTPAIEFYRRLGAQQLDAAVGECPV
jgi:GNAT superfamily N-acetyltransferase